LPPVIEPPGVQRIPASSDQAVRLVFVANLVPEKRVLDFCRVVHALQSAGLKVEGGVIGDGPDKAAAEQLCASLDPRPRIHFHGQIPNSDVWTEVATYDLFLSMRPEPLGRAIMEAMSIGLVCVCRNELGPLDYIKDGQNGILVGDSDWQAYVARLSELIPRDDLRREIGRNSIATAQAWRRSEVKALLIKAFADALMTT
jgi:glycosyltransferase involved in cell wall biosynthesis